MTTMRVVGECFFWYRLTRVFPDKFHRAVKRLCVCVCSIDYSDAANNKHRYYSAGSSMISYNEQNVPFVLVNSIHHYIILTTEVKLHKYQLHWKSYKMAEALITQMVTSYTV